MNAPIKSVDKAIFEMKEWKEKSSEGARYQEFMDRLISRVALLKNKKEMKEFSYHYDGLIRSITDSGPLTESLSPTFYDIGRTVEKWKLNDNKSRDQIESSRAAHD